MKYLLKWAGAERPNFRLAELESLCAMYGVEHSVSPVVGVEEVDDPYEAFVWVDFPSEEDGKKVIQRSVLASELYDVWGWGHSVEDAYAQAHTVTPERMGRCSEPDVTFKVVVDAYGVNMKRSYQRTIFPYWADFTLPGQVDLENPEVVLVHLEDHSLDIKQANLKAQGVAGINLDERQPFCVYIGRRITKSSRDLIQKYRLPDRAYIHTTSMSAELSFISANMAWARPGTLMMDPFAGTGSFLVACAEFGAQTLGSDIDPRVIRGTCGIGEGTVDDNFRQYGTTANYLGLNIMDFSNLPLRKQEWLDSIICDPPYGFREGARKVRIGRLRCGEDNKYPLSSLLLDLLEFAAQHLVVGGRLVYWLPMMREEFSVERIPLHPSMRLVAHASDSMKLGAARYLITMHKIAPYTPGQLEPTEEQEKVFNNYREKMFKEGEWADEDKPAPKPRRKGDARKET